MEAGPGQMSVWLNIIKKVYRILERNAKVRTPLSWEEGCCVVTRDIDKVVT